ncbi:MAG: alpha,alpha-trehalase TreF [Anaerolineaceae bacterium]|nr:alpha,alpha-trehalase TreF [Anaerolineaceae bacterium]
MKYSLILVVLIGLLTLTSVSQNNYLPPDKIYGQLFRDVQLQQIFPDGKTFVDCTPTRNPKDIVHDYMLLKNDSATLFSLEKFVKENFAEPLNPQSAYQSVKYEPVTTHIKNLWTVLRREPDTNIEGSSLLPLPYAYIVPGGRFREVYYWDSYFTMLGLQQSGELEMIENMIKNFSFLIQTYGHIPNGNRTYYLSRSQPPYFSFMIELLAEKKGNKIYADYLSALQREYDYWMDKTAGTKHVVIMPDGAVLNRYYDVDDKPRQESYKEDEELSQKESQKSGEGTKDIVYSRICRDLRSGAESGWDFSSRWFADGKNISTIQTTNMIPVDLNGLLYHLELTLAKAYKEIGNLSQSDILKQKAEVRKNAINRYCWNEKEKWYFDYNISAQKQSTELTAAGISPLFFNIASKKQALGAGKTLKQKFVKSGGVVTTLKNTGQQWDAPNGWAPLQWIAVRGLENYGQTAAAKAIAQRWIKLNIEVYERTGKLMEKYNVENTALEAGGGEYSGQDGFGWTNGVLLKLISMYGK